MGTVTGSAPTAAGGRRLTLEISDQQAGSELLGDIEIGASLAVSGVCLTVTGQPPGHLEFDVVPETVQRTRLGALEPGSRVNLEPALRMGDPLGGHWVQGHVDGTTRVLEMGAWDSASGQMVWFELPDAWRGLIVEKGSIAIDGVSLTVAGRTPGTFSIALIPHTARVTTLGSLAVSDEVHVELDILGKYVAAQLEKL